MTKKGQVSILSLNVYFSEVWDTSMFKSMSPFIDASTKQQSRILLQHGYYMLTKDPCVRFV